ncbi:MAG: geranylgeranyl reductase family protein, partial [Candidatus Nanoarchaeia archaeon]
MISVIGAGPAGCFYSSKAKDDVRIFEEHPEVGKPVACTGILTDSVRQVTPIKRDLIVSKIRKFKIVSPDGRSIYIDLKKTDLVIDRARFDQHLMALAINKGARLHLGERFLGYRKKGKSYMIKTNKGSYETDMIVGADGPRSPVAKAADIYEKRQFIKGWQARCRCRDLEEGVTTIHLNLGEFSWIVPEDDKIARVGVLGANSPKLRRDYARLTGKNKILEDQSGIIPLYNPKQKLRKGRENVFLIGDAATQVKATTYGGIIYGLIAGSYLAENKDTYVKSWNKKLAKDLWVSLKMRTMMNRMSEKQSNELLEIFKKKHNLDVLSRYSRDFPSKILVQLLMKET